MATLFLPRTSSRYSAAGGSAWLFIFLALLALVGCDGGSPPASAPPPAAPVAESPRGPVSVPFSFNWKAVPGHWVYRVTVTDAAERVLFAHEVRDATRCWPSSELKLMLADHATFMWSVAIVTPDGRSLARSATVPFSLE